MKVGIIVGRFQTPYLHEGHKALINYVNSKSDETIIFIGISEARTINNPLPLRGVFHMIDYLYGNDVTISHIMDNKSDKVWSENLDKQIHNFTSPNDEIILYGDRGSFLEKYSGKYKTEFANVTVPHVSATELRKVTHGFIGNTNDWREGVIWASAHKYPISYQTVDVAITDFNHYRLLLGRKKGCEKFQFIGGFVDTTDESLELSGKREVREECGYIETDDYEYIGSYRIDDWRYRNETDKIMTAFFCCQYIFGHPEPTDDIEELKWFDIALLSENDFEPEHRHLYAEYKKYINTHIKH